MSLVIRFSPPSLTAQQYDEVVRRLTEAGVFPADGLDYELCFGSDGNLKVSQVWDSREQLEAFGERLRPILAEMEINPGEPEVLEVHNIIKRLGPHSQLGLGGRLLDGACRRRHLARIRVGRWNLFALDWLSPARAHASFKQRLALRDEQRTDGVARRDS